MASDKDDEMLSEEQRRLRAKWKLGKDGGTELSIGPDNEDMPKAGDLAKVLTSMVAVFYKCAVIERARVNKTDPRILAALRSVNVSTPWPFHVSAALEKATAEVLQLHEVKPRRLWRRSLDKLAESFRFLPTITSKSTEFDIRADLVKYANEYNDKVLVPVQRATYAFWFKGFTKLEILDFYSYVGSYNKLIGGKRLAGAVARDENMSQEFMPLEPTIGKSFMLATFFLHLGMSRFDLEQLPAADTLTKSLYKLQPKIKARLLEGAKEGKLSHDAFIAVCDDLGCPLTHPAFEEVYRELKFAPGTDEALGKLRELLRQVKELH